MLKVCVSIIVETTLYKYHLKKKITLALGGYLSTKFILLKIVFPPFHNSKIYGKRCRSVSIYIGLVVSNY